MLLNFELHTVHLRVSNYKVVRNGRAVIQNRTSAAVVERSTFECMIVGIGSSQSQVQIIET